MIIDIIFVALVVLGYIMGAKKGFIKSVWKIAAWVLTIFLVWMLSAPFSEFVSQTDMYAAINSSIGEKVANIYASEAPALPPIFGEAAQMAAAENTGNQIASLATTALTYIALIILIRVLLGIVFRVLNIVSKLPLVSFTNKIAGGAMGVINVMFIVLIVLSVISVVGIRGAVMAIQSSEIVKYIYDNNIILKLFI